MLVIGKCFEESKESGRNSIGEKFTYKEMIVRNALRAGGSGLSDKRPCGGSVAPARIAGACQQSRGGMGQDMPKLAGCYKGVEFTVV